jgi:hypothetical protein
MLKRTVGVAVDVGGSLRGVADEEWRGGVGLALDAGAHPAISRSMASAADQREPMPDTGSVGPRRLRLPRRIALGYRNCV